MQELIGLGAKTLVVPGNLPIGCVPRYLSIFKSDNKEDYEPESGCLRWMNEFSEYHNKLLMEELEKLRKLHPDVSIIYADYYGAAMEIFLYPERFGQLIYLPCTPYCLILFVYAINAFYIFIFIQKYKTALFQIGTLWKVDSRLFIGSCFCFSDKNPKWS